MSTATLPDSSITIDWIAPLSIQQYQRMIESGILSPESPVELLENRLVMKMPKSPEHDGTIDLVGAALRAVLPGGWIVRTQQAITLVDSQPEPDFAVARGSVRSYLTRHPEAGDLGLVIEVAGSSLLRDQRDKARIYARAGIEAYWIVNLEDRRIEVHTQPSGAVNHPSYGEIAHYTAGQSVPLMLDGVPLTLAVDDCLP
jgi:Uma2 family endonuclease